MAHFPSAEMLAVAWAKTVPGIDPSKVATNLPGDSSGWSSTGFVQATVVGGSPDIYVPVYESVISFDCWANSLNSSQAPWGQAGALAAALQWATYGSLVPALAMPASYHPVRLLAVYAASVPRRIPSDASGFARVSIDVAMAWTVTAAVAA